MINHLLVNRRVAGSIVFTLLSAYIQGNDPCRSLRRFLGYMSTNQSKPLGPEVSQDSHQTLACLQMPKRLGDPKKGGDLFCQVDLTQLTVGLREVCFFGKEVLGKHSLQKDANSSWPTPGCRSPRTVGSHWFWVQRR